MNATDETQGIYAEAVCPVVICNTDITAAGRLRRLCANGLYFIFGCLFCLTAALAESIGEISFAASTPYEGRPVMLRAELFRPDGDGPFPAVVLMHGCSGLQQPVRAAMSSHAEYLVRYGFGVLSLDSFGPRENGEGWVCKTFDRLMAARRYRVADALDALTYLKSLEFVDADNIFQMGPSNGDTFFTGS